MTTVIVPVDFSETSLNAAEYAANFLTGHQGASIILYHSYAKEAELSDKEQQLNELMQRLSAAHAVKMEVLLHHDGDFVEALEKAARHRRADLIIMGITGKSAIKQVLFGSNTLKMAETKACPVLIIPEHAKFTSIKNVMLTSDFKDTRNSTPSAPIKSILNVSKPQLHVVNVDKDHYVSLTEEYEKQKQDLRKLLEEYNPEFYFLRLFELEEAINLFAKDKEIDMIIVVQKNHSFMERLFKSSQSKKLSFHSQLPILVIHE
jgi:nucleotide-binding universal stress UspA family protein